MSQGNESLAQMINKWKSGQVVISASLGGINASYEQAIQELLWEILARWDGPNYFGQAFEKYPPEYLNHVSQVANELDRQWGFSGAQVGAAKATAFQFLAYGYDHMMGKLEESRHIKVSRGKALSQESGEG